MKIKLLTVLSAVALWSCTGLFAADTNTLDAELKTLVSDVRAKLMAGKESEKDLAEEFKRFDALLDKHRGEKSETVAQAAMMHAMLHLQVGNTEKAVAAVNRLKTDFPDSEPAKDADRIVEMMEKQAKSKEIQAALSVGSQFPDFSVTDLTGKPLSLADYKGKVTLIDFWATWCQPCILELPHVIEAYEKHHDKGFEIIGISLDQENDRQKLTEFIKDRKMTWRQHFDGQGWNNKLAAKYGIQSIPATFLLDGNGKIIGKDLRGDALEKAVATALAK